MTSITRTVGSVWALCLLFFISVPLLGADVIPEDLKPWQNWVLKNDSQQLCPSAWNQANNHFCEWPAYLTLDVEATQGQFIQSGMLFDDGWVFLAGDQKNWPVAVKNNEQSLAVVLRQNTPAVYLSKGEYKITGQFSWNQLPEKLSIPKSIGVVQLSLHAKKLSNPNRDPQRI